MILLTLCILINAFISVIFKYFEKYGVDVFQAIIVNYFTCVVTGSIVLGYFPIGVSTLSQPWLPYALVLSLTFITTFTMIGLSVQGFGIVITTIFQKMSLFAPTIMGILMYHEGSGWLKIMGLALAVISIFVVTFSNKNNEITSPHSNWLYPILVLAGSSIIEILLLYVNAEGIISNGDLPFIITLFFGAGCIGLIGLLIQLMSRKTTLTIKSLWAGIGLGIPNFFSIYLLLLVLGSGMDGSVAFPINNVGILAASALLGFLFFREKIGWTKAGGLALAILAIGLIAYG